MSHDVTIMLDRADTATLWTEMAVSRLPGAVQLSVISKVLSVIDSYAVQPWEQLAESVKLSGFRRVVSRRYRMPSGEVSDQGDRQSRVGGFGLVMWAG